MPHKQFHHVSAQEKVYEPKVLHKYHPKCIDLTSEKMPVGIRSIIWNWTFRGFEICEVLCCKIKIKILIGSSSASLFKILTFWISGSLLHITIWSSYTYCRNIIKIKSCDHKLKSHDHTPMAICTTSKGHMFIKFGSDYLKT